MWNLKVEKDIISQAVRVIDQIEHGNLINMAHMVLIISLPCTRLETTKAVSFPQQMRLEIY